MSTSRHTPSRVRDIEEYYTDLPPEPSARCLYWMDRIRCGWAANRRIGVMGYHEKAEFFGVYISEYTDVLYPLLARYERKRDSRLRPTSAATIDVHGGWFWEWEKPAYG